MAHVTCSGGFLLGGAKILGSLQFAAEENRLSDPAGESPEKSIECPDGVEVRGSQSAAGTKHKPRQARGASLVHSMKCGSETAFAGDEIGPAFENLCRQTGGDGSRLGGERASHIKSACR